MSDLIGGQIQLVFAPIHGDRVHQGGKLRALAVTGVTRADVLPDTPTVAEFVPGYEASTWFGLGTPRKTVAEIVHKLNKETNACLGDPQLVARFADLGSIPMPLTPAEFGNFIADETEKWSKVIKFLGIFEFVEML